MAAKPAKKTTARKPPAKGKSKVNRKLETIDKGVDKADAVVDAMLKSRGLPDPDAPKGRKGKPMRKPAAKKSTTKKRSK